MLLEADADLRNRRAEADDLRAGIYYDLKTAFMDLKATGEQLEVATRARDAGGTALTQSRDRFAAGVANNIEVVQAQEAVSLANERYITALYLNSVGKAAAGARPRRRRGGRPAIPRRRALMADQPGPWTRATAISGARRPRHRRRHRHRRVVVEDRRASETTDDAQIDAHVAQIAARVGGTVLRVPVKDNQPVEADATLVEIDPRDYQIAVDKARAELADAEAAAQAARSNVPITSTDRGERHRHRAGLDRPGAGGRSGSRERRRRRAGAAGCGLGAAARSRGQRVQNGEATSSG